MEKYQALQCFLFGKVLQSLNHPLDFSQLFLIHGCQNCENIPHCWVWRLSARPGCILDHLPKRNTYMWEQTTLPVQEKAEDSSRAFHYSLPIQCWLWNDSSQGHRETVFLGREFRASAASHPVQKNQMREGVHVWISLSLNSWKINITKGF